MDSGDALLLLAGAIVGGLAVYMLFFRSQSYASDWNRGLQAFPEKEVVYSPVQRNEEVWSWKDWKGRDREITVHREVKRLVQ